MLRPLVAPSVGILTLLYYAYEDTLGAPMYAVYSLEPEATWVVHDVWFSSLVGFCFLIALGFRTVAVPAWVFLSTLDGTEDLLYYLLQGRLPPYGLAYLKGPLMFPQPASALTLVFGVAVSAVALPTFVLLEGRVRAWL